MGRLMKTKILIFSAWLVVNTVSAEVVTNMTDGYLLHTMIPLAQDFCAKVGMNQFTNISTNQIKRYNHYGFFSDRPGCITQLTLTNKLVFWFHTEKEKTEVENFQQNQQKTYYALNDAPVEKIKAVQALLKQNKLNQKKALTLARKYFKQLDHDEKNFRLPEIVQGYWISGNPKYDSGRLPAYTVTWYRKDVTDADLKPETGQVYRQPSVDIAVSGIDSSLISYSKNFMPLGSDF